MDLPPSSVPRLANRALDRIAVPTWCSPRRRHLVGHPMRSLPDPGDRKDPRRNHLSAVNDPAFARSIVDFIEAVSVS